MKRLFIMMAAMIFLAASCEKEEATTYKDYTPYKAVTGSAVVPIHEGWNMFSTNLELENMDAAAFFNQYTDIHFVKTLMGEVYWDLGGGTVINTIGNLDCLQGYLVHSLGDVDVILEGDYTTATMPPTLPGGWSMWGCPYQFPTYPNQGFPMPQPPEPLDLIKESVGDGVFWEYYGIDQLYNLVPYASYMVHIDDGTQWNQDDLKEYNGLQQLEIKQTKDGINTCGICDESCYYYEDGTICYNKDEAFLMVNENGVFVL